MTELSAGLDAALAQPSAIVFIALEIQLPGYTLRLIDGAGEIAIAGDLFLGVDPTYGVLAGIEPFGDGVDAQAPRLVLSLFPPTNTASAVLADPNAQRSPVKLWFGAIDSLTGLVIDEADLWFVGELDTPTLRVGQGQRLLEFEVASVWERFFRNDEGARLNNAFHQSIWPGETGFEFTTEVQRQLPWGSDVPRPTVVVDVPGVTRPINDIDLAGVIRGIFGSR